MKQFIDIHTVLSTPADMDDIHENPVLASDKLNEVLHLVYDRVDDDIDSTQLEKMLASVWEHWHQDQYLSDIEVDDLVDWVDHLVDTWDNDVQLDEH